MAKGKSGYIQCGETIHDYFLNEPRMAWLAAAATVQSGDVVVLDSSADAQVKTTTAEGAYGPVLVLAKPDASPSITIPSGTTGWFQAWGRCPVVNLMAAATRGDWLVTSTTNLKAKPVTSASLPPTGAFGRALTTGSTPEAFLLGGVYSRQAEIAIISGTGLVGGALAATITLSLAASPTVFTSRTLTAGSYMSGGGNLEDDRRFDLDHATLGALLAGTFYTETEVDAFVALAASKSIALTAGSWLTGGGDLSADRRFDFDHATLGTLLAGTFYTETEVDSLVAPAASKSITLTAGSYVSGGGDLSADRRFDVDHATLGALLAGTFYTETEVDSLVAPAASKSLTLTAGSYVSGGGDLSADRRFDVDHAELDGRYYTESEIDTQMALAASKSITLTGGTGIAAIGDLSADRTINIDTAATLAWTGVHSFTGPSIKLTDIELIGPSRIIYFDTNDYLDFTSNVWSFVIGQSTKFSVASVYTKVKSSSGLLVEGTNPWVNFESTNVKVYGDGSGDLGYACTGDHKWEIDGSQVAKLDTAASGTFHIDQVRAAASALALYDAGGTAGLCVVGGKVGIGDASPDHKLDVEGNVGLAASGYINWGDTDGASGYGFYDNAGMLQYKDSGGSWTNISSAASSAPADAPYVVTASHSGLSAQRILAAGTAIVRTVAASTVTLSVQESVLDHDGLGGFVANEHIDHTGVTLTAGSYLTGGGDLSANRRFDVVDTDLLPVIAATEPASTFARQMWVDTS